MNELAADMAETLEELRTELLGAAATITLLKSGANGFESIVTVTQSFYLKRKSNVAIGEEFLELKIAEQPGVGTVQMREVVAVEYQGERYKASLVDEAINRFRVFTLRLTDKAE